LAYWITLGTQVFVVRRVHRVDQRKVTPNRKRWFATATPWIFITILSEYFVELHLLLAGLLVMPAEVAILHICFRLRMLAAFGLRALYGLILPDVYSSHASNDWAGFRRSLLLANGLAVGYTVAVSFGLYLVGYWILAMFGEEFTAGQSALVIVSLAMVVRAAFGPAPEVLAAHDYHMSSFWILSIGAAISAVIAILLVPQMGYTALALSYTVAYNVVAIGQWWWLKHKTGIDSSIFAGVRTYLSTRQKNLQAA
jgi:O-antigen/teichoic acid export membrane protein